MGDIAVPIQTPVIDPAGIADGTIDGTAAAAPRGLAVRAGARQAGQVQ